MAVTCSYDTRTSISSAYEIDPKTGEVVPSGGRGMKPRDVSQQTTGTAADSDVNEGIHDGVTSVLAAERLARRCEELAVACDRIAAEAQRLACELRDMGRGVS